MENLGYHVTSSACLASILEEGLRPAIGPRSEMLGERRAACYLFASIEACEEGLANWLGEYLGDEELRILQVDLSGLQVDESLEWEISCATHVPAARILEVWSEDEFEHHIAQSSQMEAAPGVR